MATNRETNNQTSAMPGRRPSFSQSIGQSIGRAFGKQDGYFFELEFITNTPSHRQGEHKQILVDYVELGRSTNCAVQFKGEGIEAKVSGHHASITRNGGEWILEHLSKTNSTIINSGARIIRPDDPFKKYILQDGDTIQLAKGGPVVRFVVPRENTLQSARSKSRGTTFIRNIVSQAIAPYKKTIRTLTCVIVGMAIVFAGWAVWDNISDRKVREQLMAELENTRMENAQEVQGLQQRIEEQAARMERQRREAAASPAPAAQPGIDAMMKNQNLAKDVFFIVGKAVAIIDGNEIDIPMYVRNNSGVTRAVPFTWTATGFLLNDGRFVTARHCVEAWLYTAFNDTTTLANIVRSAETMGNIKLKAYINAFSSKSGRRLSFTSDQFSIDRSKDRVETIANSEDGTAIKWRFPMPVVEDWDQTMFATDWAVARTSESGNLEADAELSNHLDAQQQLLVMGFPMGLGVESADNIEPISYQMNVTQPGLAGNGCIMHSSGTDHGNSGGPIFAVKNGKLVVVGIVSRGDHHSSHYNWAVPISRVR